MGRYTYYYTLWGYMSITMSYCSGIMLRSVESGAGDTINNLDRGEEEKKYKPETN